MANLLLKARALADAGDVNSARTSYHEAISVEGDNPDLFEELGFLEVQAGQFHRAIELMQHALSFRPNDPSSHLNLAEVYKLSGSGELAREHYNKVVELDPNDPDGHFGLARLDAECQHWPNAAHNLKQALLRAPEDIEIQFLHALVLCEQNDWKRAEKTYKKIIAQAPNHFEAVIGLARLYQKVRRLPQAIKFFSSAETLSPLSPDDLISFIEALTIDGQAKTAIQVANKSLLSPITSTSILSRRGRVMSTLGMFDEAEKDLRAALRLDGAETGPYEQLAAIRRLNDGDIEQLEQIVDRPNTNSKQLISNWFALFNGYNERKEYAQAFAALKTACDLHLKDHPIEPSEIRNSTSNMINNFDLDFFKSRTTYGYKKSGPVFIVGMPRSGTTLTERVLGAHPELIGRGERFGVPNIIDDLDDFPNSVGQLTRDLSMEFGQALHQEILPPGQNERFAIDKLPGNYLNIGLISLVLPNAKIIWCKRNPMDNCLSCYEQNFSSGWNFTYSLEGLGVAYRQHERIMRHWMDVCPIPVHTVHYEELVNEPEQTARAMLDYVGLEWDSASLNPEQVDSNIATASMWQARQPINTGSVERWRKYEKHLQPLIKALEEN